MGPVQSEAVVDIEFLLLSGTGQSKPCRCEVRGHETRWCVGRVLWKGEVHVTIPFISAFPVTRCSEAVPRSRTDERA